MDISKHRSNETVILASCPDQTGFVAQLTTSLHEAGCNILDALQYTDAESNVFIQRIHISRSVASMEVEE